MHDQITRHNPPTVHPPIGDLYSHAVEIPPGARLLFIAGQVGADKDGKTPESTEEQLDLAWGNIREISEHAEFSMNDVIKVTCFLKGPEYATAYARSVTKYLGTNKPAMTAPIIKQLWAAEWHFEIEAIAAKFV